MFTRVASDNNTAKRNKKYTGKPKIAYYNEPEVLG